MRSLLVLLVTLSLTTSAWAVDVTLQWVAPTENVDGTPLTDLAGYHLFYGVAPGSYGPAVPVALVTQAVISGLQEGSTYWFTMTALDTSGNESLAVEPVSYTVPMPPPDTIPPGVDQSSIVDGETNVATSSTLTVRFTEAMDPASINASTVQLRTGQGALVDANVLYDAATKTVTVDPSQTLAAQSTYRLTLSGLTDEAGNPLPPMTLTFTTATDPPQVIAINAGGPAYTSPVDGTIYLSDRYASGGNTHTTSAAISNTTEDTLYRSERYGNLTYSIPVANGSYRVTLKFAEIFWTASGKRIFDVFIENIEVIKNLDIYASVGKNRAFDRSFNVQVADGFLTIRLRTDRDQAKISAIRVARQ